MSLLASSSLEPGTHFHGHEERQERLPETRRRPRGRGGAGRDEAGGRGIGRGRAGAAGAKPIETVRVGFVGVGVKGSEHVANLLRLDGVELKAVCDIREEACAAARRQAEALGKREPTAYTRGRARLRADVRGRGPRPGLYRHPLGVARPGLPRGDAQRQARRHRGARRDHPGRMLAARGDRGADRQVLRR